jgi:hypothetical protein
MNKEEAIKEIHSIQCGSGIRRNRFPEEMRGSIANNIWNDGKFTLGFEYGYMLALMDAFSITEFDLTVEKMAQRIDEEPIKQLRKRKSEEE